MKEVFMVSHETHKGFIPTSFMNVIWKQIVQEVLQDILHKYKSVILGQ